RPVRLHVERGRLRGPPAGGHLQQRRGMAPLEPVAAGAGAAAHVPGGTDAGAAAAVSGDDALLPRSLSEVTTMRSARSSMLLAMTLLAPAFAATPASAQSIAFVSDLVGDPSLDSVADLIGDPSSEFLADPMADPSADVVAGPPLELAVAPALAGPRPMTDDDLAEARG